MTLHEAAAELGVHYMTAYRYVRLGLLDAAKSGGAWQVSRSALDAFREGARTAPVKGRRGAPWAERLESRLLAGDARGAWGVIEAAQASGAELSEIYLEVLSPAMVSIGSRWERGEVDISVEHRASGIALRLVGRLGPRFARRGRPRGSVILAGPAGERHALPIAILSDLLRLEGWEAHDLGADVPSGSLVYAVRENPDVFAVGLSVTASENLEACAEACAAVRAADPAMFVIVGGRAIVDDEHARALGAHACATDGASMAALLDGRTTQRDDDRVGGSAAG